MAGIIDWGCHIAKHRLPLAILSGKPAGGGPERSLAWADEDAVTLAVEAARQALDGHDRSEIDLLAFATTTHAFEEKQGAALIAAALGLSTDTRTLDIGHSLRGAVEALLLADDAIRSGRARKALVIASDCRMGAPGSALERNGGDGAVAFLLGSTDCTATITAHAAQSEEIVDIWRRSGDRFVHGWEERFTSQYGFLEPSTAAAAKLPAAADDARRFWATSAPDQRSSATLARVLKANGDTMPTPLCGTVGFCGAAHAPLMLAATLELAEAGDEIAMLSHGDGAEALLLTVGKSAEKKRFTDSLTTRIPVSSQAAYRRARAIDPGEYPPLDDQGISATIHYRDRAEDLRLQGQRCSCGEPQFPKGRVCIRCGKKDNFTPEDFAERTGSLVTYTLDAFFPSPNPPTAVGIVKVENGPRIYLQVAELPGKEPELGMELRFVFRRIHDVGKRPNYFWKAVPAGRQG
ncbi:MAG: OB-fold domain-containing protein [Sphingomonadaceae bacterium]|nr:OB-fold domain-containing protein [Sphingomonadaceae bacterium]